MPLLAVRQAWAQFAESALPEALADHAAQDAARAADAAVVEGRVSPAAFLKLGVAGGDVCQEVQAGITLCGVVTVDHAIALDGTRLGRAVQVLPVQRAHGVSRVPQLGQQACG